MMYLYDRNETNFVHNGIPLRDAYDAHVIREEGFYLKFKLLLKGQHKQIKKEMIVSAETPSGFNQFRVFDIHPHGDHLEVVALHLFYYLDNRLVRPFSLKGATGVEVIRGFASQFVSDITPYTFDSSVGEIHDFQASTRDGEDDSYLNALEVINRIGNRWDSEFELNGFDVRMVKRLGRRTHALLYEKKNISDFEEETTIRHLVTRIHAVSKWTLSHDDKGYVQDGDNEREIRIVVDSPLINQYSQIYEAEYTNNDLRTEKELRAWANLKYSTHNMDKPKRNIKVKTNIIDGTEINLGDELVLKYLIHDVDEVIRCVGYDYDPIGKHYYEITLGDWRQSFSDTIGKSVSDVSDRQKSQLETLQKQVQLVQMQADGIGRVTYGPHPVPNPRDRDIWYYYTLDRPNEVETRIYDSKIGDWRKSSFDQDAFDKKIAEVANQIEAIDATIAESDRKAQEALEKAGVSTDLAKEVREEVLESQKEIQETQVSLIQYAKELQSLGEMSEQTKTEVSGLQQTLEGLNSTVTQTLMDPQTGLIRQIQSQQEQTAEVLKSKLSVSEVDGLIEGKNLLSVSQYTHEKEETAKGVARQLSAIRGGVLSVFGIRNYILASDDFVTSGRKTFKVSDEFIRLAKPGTQFVFSAEVEGSDLVARGRSRYGGQVVIRYTDGTTQWAGAWQLGTEGTETKRISEVYTIPAGKTIQSMEALIDSEIGGKVRVANPMLEISSVPNEWQLALEDGDQQLTTAKLAEYKQTVDSQLAKLSSTVEDPKTGLMKRLENYQTQTAEALQSKLTSTEVESLIDGKGLLSVERYTHDRTETAQIFERTLTELKDTIPSEVGARNYVRGSAEMKKGNGNWDTGTFRHSGPGTSETIEISDFPNQNITKAIKLTRGEEGETGIAQDHFNLSEDDWTISWWVKAPIGSEIRVQAYWSNDNRSTGVSTPFTSETDEWQRLRFTATNETAGRVSIAYIYLMTGSEMLVTAPKLEKGKVLTDWSPAPEDYRSEWTTKLTQMADSIDLALFNQKGAVSRIHLNQEGIRLKGKLLHLDGQTVIDNGVIKSAHIQSLDAGKIVTGSLDASRVRVINLDANNITANKTSFVQSAWNGINRHTFIGSDGIRVNHSDGSYTLLGAKGIETYIGGTGYRTHYLTNTYMIKGLNFSQHWETAEKYKADGMKYGVRWYKLPSVYAGKNYSATCSLADVEFYDGAEWVLQRTVAYVDQERLAPARAKGEAPIVAYAIFANIKTGKTKAYPVSVSLVVTL